MQNVAITNTRLFINYQNMTVPELHYIVFIVVGPHKVLCIAALSEMQGYPTLSRLIDNINILKQNKEEIQRKYSLL
jgi:hypothetical protein